MSASRWGLVSCNAMGVCLWVAGFLSPSGFAHAALIRFEANTGDETRTAHTEPMDQAGVAYVSLSSVVRQFRGECNLLPARAQVDFMGRTAWLHVREAEVDSSLGTFVLPHPVLTKDDQLLIALSDVEAFFAQAFRVSVRTVHEGEMASSAAPAPGGQSPVAPPAQGVQREPEVLDLLPSPDGTTPAQTAHTEAPAEAPPADAQAPPGSTLWEGGVVVIDPGHGGSDEGGVGPNGQKEKDLTLAIALHLRQEIEQRCGVKVVLTREKDVDTSLAARTEVGRQQRAGVFISIHTGASYSPSAHGFELFCPASAPGAGPRASGASDSHQAAPFAPVSLAMAEAMAQSMAAATGESCRGIHQVSCCVLEDVPTPGLLIEVGCLSNGAQEALLATESFQAQLAQGIAGALKTTLNGAAGATP